MKLIKEFDINPLGPTRLVAPKDSLVVTAFGTSQDIFVVFLHPDTAQLDTYDLIVVEADEYIPDHVQYVGYVAGKHVLLKTNPPAFLGTWKP